MVRGLAVACAIALTGCASTGAATATNSLEGQQLDAALGRYGAWAEQTNLGGKPTYIWRRSYVAADQAFFCELRIETGFRQTIAHTSMQGMPDACRLFSVRYSAPGN